MNPSGQTRRLIVGVTLFATAFIFGGCDPSEPPPPRSSQPIQALQRFEIPEGGRFSLQQDQITDQPQVIFRLALDQSRQPIGIRSVRVAGTDGRRLTPLHEEHSTGGGGLQITLRTADLLPGLYLFEVDTIEDQPVSLRRYVLTIE